MVHNKKAYTTLGLIFIIFIALVTLTILGILSFGANLVDNAISGLDINIGNTSFNATYQQLMHPGMETIETTTPQIISIGVILGMVLCLMLVASKTSKKANLWIVLDICLIIIAEIIAISVRDTFRDNIMNISPELFNVFTTTMSVPAKWVLNLPTIIPTIGVLVMIATYVLKKERDDDEDEVQGDLGGFYQIEGE